MRASLRNKCKHCNHAWFPWGRNVDPKCPKCGSSDVTPASNALAWAVIVFVLLSLFAGKGHYLPDPSGASAPSPSPFDASEPMVMGPAPASHLTAPSATKDASQPADASAPAQDQQASAPAAQPEPAAAPQNSVAPGNSNASAPGHAAAN